MAGTHLDGVHDDPETGHGELVGVPQVVVVQVAGTQRRHGVQLALLPTGGDKHSLLQV